MDTSASVRQLIIHHHNQHISVRAISQMVNVPKSTVGRIIKNHSTTGSTQVRRHGRCGRKRLIGERTARLMARRSIINARLTARQIQHQTPTAANVSLDTVKRSLRRSGLVCRRPVKAPMLTPARMVTRLRWANRYRNWNVENWRRVVFTDETCIDVTVARSQFVRRLRGAPIRSSHVSLHRPFLQRVMFWGCISHRGRGPLVAVDGTMNAARYLDLLQNHLLPYGEVFGEDNWYLQQDNAPCHKAQVVTEFLLDNGLPTIDWPPYSPDMNVIENVWAMLKRKVHEHEHTTKQEVIVRAQFIWNNDLEIDRLCQSIADSMPRRLNELRRVYGGYTHY